MASVYDNQKKGIKISPKSSPLMPNILTKLVWLLFLVFSAMAVVNESVLKQWDLPGWIHFDGLTLVMWITVTFFSGIVHSYSLRYMAGNHHINGFFVMCFAFTFSVLLLTALDHLWLFTGSWFFMGLLMARLIGHNRQWGEARLAGRHALWYFFISTMLLVAGSGLLVYATGEVTISSIIQSFNSLGLEILISAGLLIFLAAMMQSALFPFQSWLMSSMTAPTPASALMHAGFVNAGGILLARFAPIYYEAHLLWLIVLIGGIGALIGKFWKFVQSNYKRKLGCSTVSQMGFMILQCGLGFFTAAITHLILHGFYKAFLFLSSGTRVAHTVPSDKDRTIAGPAKLPVILLSGILGGWLFAAMTSKGFAWNSGLLLTFVVVLTVIHGVQDIVKRHELSGLTRILAIPLLFVPAIVVYALIFNAVSGLMEGMPMIQQTTPLRWYHALITVAYLAAFLTIEFSWHHKQKRLYVALLNLSQPHPGTVLTFKK